MEMPALIPLSIKRLMSWSLKSSSSTPVFLQKSVPTKARRATVVQAKSRQTFPAEVFEVFEVSYQQRFGAELFFSFSLRSRDSNFSRGFVKASSRLWPQIGQNRGGTQRNGLKRPPFTRLSLQMCVCNSSGVISGGFLPHIRLHPPFFCQDV